MNNTARKLPHLAEFQWKPGQSGNPGGKPAGARNKLEALFLDDLLADWQQHGKATLVIAREKDPVGYVRVAASLMPKQVDANDGLEGIDREQLRIAIAALQSFITPRAAPVDRDDPSQSIQAG